MRRAESTPHSEYRLEVQWGDCDPADIVYYPNYYRWFDNASHRLFNQRELDIGTLSRRYGALGFPLVNTSARFIRTATVGDLLVVESTVVAMSRKTLTVEHRVRCDGELLVEGQEIRILGRKDATGRLGAAEIPADIRRALGFAADA